MYVCICVCVKDLLLSQCTIRSQDTEVFDFLIGDFNPFCDNNRDPGATGSDQCVDYPPDPTPTNTPCNRSDVISAAKQFIFTRKMAKPFPSIVLD